MNRELAPTLAELKAGLAALYGERLKGVYLFGSCARGEEDQESDVDVLVVLDRVVNYAREVDRSSEVVAQVSLRCGRSLSCVFAPEDKWQHDQSMFLTNVRAEAVPA